MSYESIEAVRAEPVEALSFFNNGREREAFDRLRPNGGWMRRIYERFFTASDQDIDELGHVNNAAWVRWIQDMATEHWRAAAEPAHVDAYIWVVVRHEIDYLRAALPGETVTGRTWVAEAPKGARFDRHVEFVGADGRLKVRAKTTWAILDKATGRPLRVPPEVAAPFLDSSPAFAGEGDHAEHGGGVSSSQ